MITKPLLNELQPPELTRRCFHDAPHWPSFVTAMDVGEDPKKEIKKIKF
jgi:hypothetical protein